MQIEALAKGKAYKEPMLYSFGLGLEVASADCISEREFTQGALNCYASLVGALDECMWTVLGACAVDCAGREVWLYVAAKAYVRADELTRLSESATILRIRALALAYIGGVICVICDYIECDSCVIEALEARVVPAVRTGRAPWALSTCCVPDKLARLVSFTTLART